MLFVTYRKLLTVQAQPPVDMDTDEWSIIEFSDSDFGGDKETRISTHKHDLIDGQTKTTQ